MVKGNGRKTAGRRALIGLGVGVLSGLGLKYIWEAAKGPGYGSILFKVSDANNGTYFGVDDAIGAGIGGAIALVGARKKDSMLTGVGTGTALGIVANKLLEVSGVTVCPIDGTFANGQRCR